MTGRETQKLAMSNGIFSSLGLKYPRNRDHPLKNGYLWIEDKKATDGAEGLWRILDNLYDFQDFVKTHPGGSMWLEITKVSIICF